KDLAKDFGEKYRISKEVVIKYVYQRPTPNVYLASFVPFMADHIEHPHVTDLLKKGFREYIRTNITTLDDHKEYVCHFVGSIAFHFQEQLRPACAHYGIEVGTILKSPIDELF